MTNQKDKVTLEDLINELGEWRRRDYAESCAYDDYARSGKMKQNKQVIRDIEKAIEDKKKQIGIL